MRNVKIILVLGVLFLSATALAKDITFEASVDRDKVSLGSSIQLNLAFNNSRDIPAFELPQIEGFQSQYLGPSSMMSIVNGQVSSSVTHMYVLLPVKLGTFKLGPFKFENKGDTYVSNELAVEVVQGQVSASQLNSQEPAAADVGDVSDRIFVIMEPKKNRVYLNEIVPLTVKLYVNQLGARDIQYPQIGHDGFSLGEFGQYKQYQEVLGGVNYEVIEFDTSFFALRPGDLKLGPAEIKCNLIAKKQGRARNRPFGFDDFFADDIFDDFFSRYEIYPLDLKSAQVPVYVSGLPEENKPGDFSGALGDFGLDVAVSPQEVKAGDPVTVKAIVSGEGNFSTLNIPKISDEKNFKSYEPQVKQEAGQKTFEQVLIPLNDSVKEVPAVVLSFFNTNTGQYQTITRGPFPVKVLPPDKPEEQKITESRRSFAPAASEEKFGRDIMFIKDFIGATRIKGDYFYKNPLFLFLLILPSLIYLIAAYFYGQKMRLAGDVRYARQLSAPRKAREGLRKARENMNVGKVREFYDAMFNTLQEYLGDKFHLASKSITVSIVDDVLAPKGYPPDVLKKLKDIFKDCDLARFASGQLRGEDMTAALRKLEEAIDYLQKNQN